MPCLARMKGKKEGKEGGRASVGPALAWSLQTCHSLMWSLGEKVGGRNRKETSHHLPLPAPPPPGNPRDKGEARRSKAFAGLHLASRPWVPHTHSPE